MIAGLIEEEIADIVDNGAWSESLESEEDGRGRLAELAIQEA